jgi:hypothetical protein
VIFRWVIRVELTLLAVFAMMLYFFNPTVLFAYFMGFATGFSFAVIFIRAYDDRNT